MWSHLVCFRELTSPIGCLIVLAAMVIFNNITKFGFFSKVKP
jgi:hypothetical protein